METPSFLLILDPSDAAVMEIRRRLQDFNDPFWEVREKRRFVLRATVGGGFVGGVVLTVFGRWLEVDFLMVEETARGTGLGSELLRRAEELGRSHGCERATLNTFSFQARPFYEKNGYRTVYQREGYPRTSTQYFMEKAL